MTEDDGLTANFADLSGTAVLFAVADFLPVAGLLAGTDDCSASELAAAADLAAAVDFGVAFGFAADFAAFLAITSLTRSDFVKFLHAPRGFYDQSAIGKGLRCQFLQSNPGLPLFFDDDTRIEDSTPSETANMVAVLHLPDKPAVLNFFEKLHE